jgi:hypothetical protein
MKKKYITPEFKTVHIQQNRMLCASVYGDGDINMTNPEEAEDVDGGPNYGW